MLSSRVYLRRSIALSLRLKNQSRQYATPAPNRVKIVEVGPRDGLQNEKSVISPDVKVELINRLGKAGMTAIEAGSFVSPKWVPQVIHQHFISYATNAHGITSDAKMAGTGEVISKMTRLPGRHYPVLIPNLKGLEHLLNLLAKHPPSPSSPPPTDEIAIFSAATDEFSKANTNCTVAESLARLEPVATTALQKGLRVRGCALDLLRLNRALK